MLECKNELVLKLGYGAHVVSLENRIPEPKRVDERIKNGFVFLKFMQTRGGTELGINLVRDECDFSNGDFKERRGKLHIVGTCKLNYCKVKCVADVDLKTREGLGHLKLI